jgi:hypothetical protein
MKTIATRSLPIGAAEKVIPATDEPAASIADAISETVTATPGHRRGRHRRGGQTDYRYHDDKAQPHARNEDYDQKHRGLLRVRPGER